jgi:WD40 repeat protein
MPQPFICPHCGAATTESVDAGLHCSSSRLTDGARLVQRVAEAPLPPRESAALLIKVARALVAARVRGAPYHDLSLDDVTLDAKGEPRLTISGRTPSTAVRRDRANDEPTIAVTGYLSPERIRADADPPGPRSDVYALGAVLYALLAGRPPFQSSTAPETIDQVLYQQPVSPRRLAPQTPIELEKVCLKCLEKSPSKRYDSVDTLVADLDRWLSGRPIVARSVGGPTRIVRLFRRDPIPFVIGVGVGMGAIAVLVVCGALASRTSRFWPTAAPTGPQLSTEARYSSAAIGHANQLQQEIERIQRTRGRADYLRYIWGINLAQREIDDGDLAKARLLLTELVPRQASDSDDRGFEWHWLSVASHPELRVLTGHDGAIRRMEFTPDGRLLLTVGDDGTARIWEAASGREVQKLQHPVHFVRDARFRPDGRRAAVCAANGETRILDVRTGEILRVLEGGASPIERVAWSPNGDRLAAIGRDGSTRVWDADSGSLRRTWNGQHGPTMYASFSPDGRRLLTAGSNGGACLWDVESGEPRFTIEADAGPMKEAAFSPDGARIATIGADQTLRIADAASGKILKTRLSHQAKLSQLLFSPDGSRFASAGDAIRVWDAILGQPLRTLESVNASPTVTRIACDWDRGRVAAAAMDGTVCIYDMTNGRELLHIRGHHGPVWDVAFSPDGRCLTTGGADGTARIWDSTNGGSTDVIMACDQQVAQVGFSTDGRRLASASTDGRVRIWDGELGREVLDVKIDAGDILAMGFEPDGRRLATASADGVVRILDTATGQILPSHSGHTDRVTRLVYRPDGRRFATASDDGTTRVWDARTGRPLSTLSEGSRYVRQVAYSRDGRYLAATATDGAVKLWDAETSQPIHSLQCGASEVLDLVFSRDCKKLAAARADGSIQYWDLAKGVRVHELPRQADRFEHLIFNPESSTWAACGEDGAISVWAVGQPVALFTLRGHTALVRDMGFSPDGRRFVTASDDGTARIWDGRGRELMRIRANSGSFRRVMFSPDGSQLAAVESNGSIRLWNATPVDAQSEDLREAVGLVGFWIRAASSESDLVARIKSDPTISNSVRHAALTLAGPSWKSEKRLSASPQAKEH